MRTLCPSRNCKLPGVIYPGCFRAWASSLVLIDTSQNGLSRQPSFLIFCLFGDCSCLTIHVYCEPSLERWSTDFQAGDTALICSTGWKVNPVNLAVLNTVLLHLGTMRSALSICRLQAWNFLSTSLDSDVLDIYFFLYLFLSILLHLISILKGISKIAKIRMTFILVSLWCYRNIYIDFKEILSWRGYRHLGSVQHSDHKNSKTARLHAQ